MKLFAVPRHLVLIAVLLGIAHSVYPIRPSVLLKRSLLRRRLLTMPATLRPKRQLFREDIPHHRPLTGNTYYLHAGFPHPSRWHDGAQVIPPHPNPVTHHHFHKKPGLHDDHQNNNNAHHNNNNLGNQEQHLIHPHPPPHNLMHHNQQQHHHNGINGPMAISVVNSQTPHTVNFHSAIVHANGLVGGGVIGNGLNNLGPHSPADQANFDPLFSQLTPGPAGPTTGHFRNAPKKQPQKPHSEPDHYDDEYGTGGDYDIFKDTPFQNPESVQPLPPPPKTEAPVVLVKKPERKPKTIIHFHPVSVGNIINFNDDNKPVVVTPPSHSSYGPPDHVPGAPLAQKDVLLSMADPFIKSPYKTVNGPPEFLDFTKDHHHNVQYGPPQHVPGLPLGNLDLAPMVPSYGPPLKSEAEPPYGVALPVIAHLHSGPPQHHHHHHPPPPPKPYRGKGRGLHHHHLHLHHIHHPPTVAHPPVEGPFLDVKHPTYVVHGHVPSKFVSFHSPHFRSHHHHHKSFWSW